MKQPLNEEFKRMQKLEGIIGNFYKLVLNPLYIEKYEKEALQFHDQYNKERS